MPPHLAGYGHIAGNAHRSVERRQRQPPHSLTRRDATAGAKGTVPCWNCSCRIQPDPGYERNGDVTSTGGRLAHWLVLRPCPAGDAPASFCPPQRYREDRVGFLNGFPMLLVIVCG